MANIIATVYTAEIALAAATTKTLLQITAPANQRVKILRYGVSFDGVSATGAPVQIYAGKQTGVWTGTANVPTRVTPGTETVQTTAKDAMTVEGTQGVRVDATHVHPQSSYIRDLAYGQEVILAGGEMFGISVNADAIVNAKAFIEFEE